MPINPRINYDVVEQVLCYKISSILLFLFMIIFCLFMPLFPSESIIIVLLLDMSSDKHTYTQLRPLEAIFQIERQNKFINYLF